MTNRNFHHRHQQTNDYQDILNENIEGGIRYPKYMIRGILISREHSSLQDGIEGEQHHANSLVEGESTKLNIENDNLVVDNDDYIFVVYDLSEPEEAFEDENLDFDSSFPPLDKWKKSHRNEQILCDPTSGALTRAPVQARNEVLNVHQEYCMYHIFLSKIEPKQ